MAFMQDQQELNDFLERIPVVNEANNHWFFRTMGGKLYQPFFYKSIIALDYTNIEEKKVAGLIEGDVNEAKISFVKSKYPNHRRPGLIIANLKRFYNEMKIDDIVLIPNAAGKNLAVGKIASNVETIKGIERIKSDGKAYIDSEYKRARKVKWIAAARRRNFSP
jgi:predicted Mrr-cat superfamily restriction endonuclease